MTEPIKTMKLYTDVDRIFNELRELGVAEHERIQIGALTPFDQYHYEGTAAVEYAINVCGINADQHVLEVGSGIGGPSRYIAHRTGCTVTALELQADLNQTAAQLTQRCGLADHVQHQQGDFLDTDSIGDNYDALVSWLAFLHIPNRQHLFARCMASLKPGGYLFIEDFSKRGDFSAQELSDLETKIYCGYVPTQDEYIDQVAAAGFADIQADDMTESWTRFVRGRLDGFRAARERHLRVHNENIVAGLDDFFSTITNLYEGGNLGGIRLVARKPMDGKQIMNG